MLYDVTPTTVYPAFMLVGIQVHGDSLLEDVIDLLLLGNIAADDPMSVPMCHYLHFMTLLQSALQYIWDLHRRQAAMLAATVEASDTACAYNTALQQYVKAVHGDLKQVGATDVGSTPAFVSEALRVQLRAVKRVSDAAVKGLQVCCSFVLADCQKRITHGWTQVSLS